MELVLWRHADAEEGSDDAARRLTPQGIEQARRVAAWLDARLSPEARLLVSPAQRARQTAQALSRAFTISPAVNTDAQATDVLKAAGWPSGTGTVVVVGHQPTLGAAAALALTGTPTPWRLKKCGVWWISCDSDGARTVVAVVAPDVV